MSTTIQFHAEAPKKSGPCGGRASCVHAVQMFSPEDTKFILDDAKQIGTSIGWSDRGVSLPTQDVLVQNLSQESQDLVHRAIREQLLPFARRQYPHLTAAFDKQPYPRPGNLFIVRYSASSQRPGGRGLKLHKDETALTFNLCLSHEDEFTGGGTYFPAVSSDVDGILLRPKGGYCLMHDGNIKHAGNEVRTGDRFILVGFYNADGRDRAGEEEFFGSAAREEARLRAQLPPPVQTIYFTTAVAAHTQGGFVPVDVGAGAGGDADASQQPGEGEEQGPPPARGMAAAASVHSGGAGGWRGGGPPDVLVADCEDETTNLRDSLEGEGGGYWRSRDPQSKAQPRGASPPTCMPTWIQVLQGRWRPAAAALAK